MNKKIIVLIGMLFCGSFGVMASEAPVALSYDEKDRIYRNLINKYDHKALTAADNNKINLMVLNDKIEEIKKREITYPYHRGMAEGALILLAAPTSFIGGALIDYTGRVTRNILDSLAHKEIFSSQKTTLETASKIIRAGTLLGSVPLFAYAGFIASLPIQIKIADYISDTKLWFEFKIQNYREIARIKSVIKAIKAAPVK